ncbi:hypothetical protein [Paracoccus hibiscisoli]|uniref:DNA topology modulation protein FlaR n=1 Tax=Paracoccus hibiscisoli TaxID=2023261 RepID=A0A4U0Q7P2_9RHOB|nr:hypothetical protein [Paracoccus hibiscisoli]TJZ76870.1 hypothetical protein FA740_19295 [Paracoccus hibiscisoli]
MEIIKRVMVLGGSGVGKTWLTLQLAKRFRLPGHHIDQLSWQPGFIHRTAEELDEMTRAVHAGDEWVLEGGHYETAHERARRAQLLVWVDPVSATQLTRVVWRSLRYHGKVRPGMGEGCVEWFGARTKEAAHYALTSREFHRERAREVIASAPPTLPVVHLRSSLQTYQFLWNCRCHPAESGFTMKPRLVQAYTRSIARAVIAMAMPAALLGIGVDFGMETQTVY